MAGKIRKFFRNWVHPYELGKVYTPTTVAKLAYVRRNELEQKFIKYFKLAGKQIILYGHSGSGKTTLVNNILESNGIKYIITQCESASTFNDILINAFDELNLYYTKEVSDKSSSKTEGELSAEINSIGAALKQTITEEHEETFVRILPPQLTPQRLSETLGKLGLVWIIEDFHKVANPEKKRIADLIKIFIDKANQYPKLKIICIGAVDTAREMILLEPNLSTRIVELNVPLLTDDEILEIINQGSDCLNIMMSDALKDKIIHYSNRLASMAHQMCYDMCYSNGVYKTCRKKTVIGDEKFKDAIESYLESNSDTFRSVYESSIKEPVGWYVLKTFAVYGHNKLPFKVIKKKVCSKNRSFTNDEINSKLIELSSCQNNILRFDPNSGKYSISSPFWGAFLKMQHAIEEANNSQIAKDRNNLNLLLENQNDYDALLLRLLLNKWKETTRNH